MKWFVVALVLLGLLVAADRVGEQVAERVLADQLQGELGTRPTVEVEGFPFLTQALRGRYSDIRVSAGSVQRDGLRLQGFTSSLTGARVPLSDAVGGDVAAVPVEGLTASGVVSYDELEALSGDRGLQLSADPEGVRVSGSVRVLGRDVAASAVSAVRLDGSTIVVTASRLEVDGAPVSGPVGRALSGRLDLRLPLPPLPYDVRLVSVRGGPDGVTVTGSARDLVLTR